MDWEANDGCDPDEEPEEEFNELHVLDADPANDEPTPSDSDPNVGGFQNFLPPTPRKTRGQA